ncbi:MAG: diguanylate cyclase [Candidatus Sericytochromatia bacterium]|nr:diguanylate cyclase [Candidatus Sericytochromatia bacterium]
MKNTLTFLRSIRFRLPMLFMMVSAIPAVVAIVWISSLLNERMEVLLQQRVRDSALTAHNIFEEYAQDILLKARLVTQTQQVQSTLRQQDKIALINQLSALRQDLNLGVYNATVEIFDASGKLFVAEPKRSLQQVSDTLVYTAMHRGQYRVSRFFEDDQLRLATALPIFHPEEARPIGAVALSFNVSHKLADEIHKLSAAEVLIFVAPLGEPARLLATTLDEQSSENLIARYLAEDLRLNQHPEYLLAAVRGDARNGQYYVAAALQTRDMLGLIASLKQILLFVAGAAALLALIFALGLSRNLINRIVYLVQAARKVEHGELDIRIQLDSDDEFGILARNLDSMRQEIQQTLQQKESMITNLTIRDQLNQAIITQAGADLLKEVLMIIIRAINAQKGSIMMVDEDSGKLMLKVVYDPDQGEEPINILEHISFAIGEGIAGQVAATGEALICNEPQHDKRFKTYRFQEMDRRIWNIICIPLKVQDQVLGVISLDNKVGGFEDEDLTLLNHLAHQIAIAIQNAELYERSIIDGLTGLFIRRYFEDLLDQELKRSQRFELETSLLMFDIDHFKRFNDTYGHQVGDWVIQKVAQVTRESLRDGVDMAARYGGEEFAVIMPDTSLEEAWLVGERLRKAIEESFIFHDGHKLKITISLGCASFPAQAQSKEQLILFADTALYASKHKGRNCTTRYHSDLSLYERGVFTDR